MAPGRRSSWTPEQVHRWHRRLRKERLERKAAGIAETEPALRDLERQLGRLRDLDLLIELLAEPRAEPELAPERAWRQATRSTLSDQRQVAAQAVALPPPRPIPAPHREVAGAAAIRRLARDISRALDRPTAKRVHAVRQAIRRVEAARTVAAAPGSPYERPRRVARIMSTLGRVHDLDRSVDQLRSLLPCIPRDAWIDDLRAHRTRRVRTARQRLKRSGAKKLFNGG
jgi:CHAD domain-containing protein